MLGVHPEAQMLPDVHYDDAYLRQILRDTKVVAMVGASPKWVRPSHFVFKYLQNKGYRVIPVNPLNAGETILGEKVYAKLADVPLRIDAVDVFRNSEAAGPITDEAIAIGAKTVWMELGGYNPAAAERAAAARLKVGVNH